MKSSTVRVVETYFLYAEAELETGESFHKRRWPKHVV